jgi:hypothetical protein
MTEQEKAQVRTMVLAKMADERYFTDPERGVLAEMFAATSDAAEQTKQAHAPRNGQQHNIDLQKVASDARQLSSQELDAVIDKVAEGLPEETVNAVIKQAYEDIEREAAAEYEKQKVGMELGYYMFHGFNKAAAQAVHSQQTKQASANLSSKAPYLSALLGQ